LAAERARSIITTGDPRGNDWSRATGLMEERQVMMTKLAPRRRAACLLLALAALATPPPAQAQQRAVSDDRVRELLALVRQQQGTPAAPQPATSATPAGRPLSLEEAVALALERNLDIAVQRMNPRTYDLSVQALKASYLPNVTSTIGQNNTVQLPRNQLTGGPNVENDTTTYNFGVAQNLPWGGGGATLGWTNSKLESTSSLNTFNPQYNSTLTANLTQPLLRNFTTDTNRAQIKITQLNRDISVEDVRAVVTNTVADVRDAYWDLVYAIDFVAVAQQSLQLAEKLLADDRTRVEVGTMAPLDVIQDQAEVAARQQALTQADATMQTAELSLKRLIVSGTEDPNWKAHLQPTDRPVYQEPSINLEAALRRALERRTDLIQQHRTLDINEMNLKLLKNQSLPQADFVANYGLQGIGGTRLIRDNTVIGSPITGSVPGGFSDALHVLGQRDYPTWNVAVQFSYPIGTSASEANYQRAKITLEQAQTNVKSLELQIATDVANAALQVTSNSKQFAAASAARELSQKRLEAEQSKFEVGLSTNFLVVQAQRDLATAQNSELLALLNYRKSLVDFERVQETRGTSGTSAATSTAARTTTGTTTTGSSTTGSSTTGSTISSTGTTSSSSSGGVVVTP
jgi:outer membrane protein TolC